MMSTGSTRSINWPLAVNLYKHMHFTCEDNQLSSSLCGQHHLAGGQSESVRLRPTLSWLMELWVAQTLLILAQTKVMCRELGAFDGSKICSCR
jgi:hypothetical protein